MTTRLRFAGEIVLAALLASGCSQTDPSSPSAAGGSRAAPSGAAYLLPSEPSGAMGVSEALASTEDGDAITVVGRVGGTKSPFVDGAAAFLIADESLKPCDDGCPVPWDYCCSPNLAESKATVRIVDPEGRIVAADARELLGIKELETVVVRGRAKRDGLGNLTVMAEGIHIRP
jgi:hypothetical protein